MLTKHQKSLYLYKFVSIEPEYLAMKKPLYTLLFLLLSFIIKAQQFEFSHLNNTNGLSNNQVEAILKDSRGFMWFGTNMGLNRYDGINFKTYKNIKNDSKSPSYDRFTGIQEDINGNLWLQSSAGIYMLYDWKSESFINNIDSLLSDIGLPPAPAIIEIDKKKDLYISYPGKGIHKYDATSNKITIYKQSKNTNDLALSDISDIKIKDSYIWVLHNDGLLERVNMQTNRVDMRNTFFKDNNQNSTIQKSLFIDSDNDIWVYPSIADKGVVYLNTKKGLWTLLDTNSKVALSSSFVRCVGQDINGLIWIGTDHGGISILDKKNQKITVLKNDIYNHNSISQNSIISFYSEPNGTVWVGTYKSGASYYHPNLFKFKKSPLFYMFNKNAEIFDCNSLYKDKSNNLWIGTNGTGLIKYDQNTEKIERFRNNPNDAGSISSDIITSIYEDHRQTLWIGTFMGGLNAFDGKSFKKFQLNETNPNSLSSKSVYSLTEDNDHNLWIATLGGGIDQLNPARDTFTHHNMSNSKDLLSNYIVSMFVDTQNNIFLSTDRGICVLDESKKEVRKYFPNNTFLDSLTSIVINNLIVDSRGLLWIATDKGINVYYPTKQRFEYITTNEGLPGDEVVSLIEDNDGNIWAGTRNGLVCFYCKYDNQKLTYTIASFDVNDGLPGSVFNTNAIFKDKDGIIYIGSTKGYTSFDPRKIVFNKNVPKPHFTDLLITNQVIKPNTKYNGRVILEKSITDLDEIVLHYGETNFTIQFSSLNYIHPEKNRYKYMLEGLDNKWTETSTGIGSASYSNLNAGTYKLIVYASNDDNVWSSDPIVLTIVVKPPF